MYMVQAMVNISEEANRVLNIVKAQYGLKDKSEAISKQIGLLRKENYPENHGLFETNIIFRKHKDAMIIKLMKDWWDMICNFSYRDQLSFNYVLWKNNQICLQLFPINARLMDDFAFKRHNPQAASTLYVDSGLGFNNKDTVRKKIIVTDNKFNISFDPQEVSSLKQVEDLIVLVEDNLLD